jgi:ketosteroid isomerase-like protein
MSVREDFMPKARGAITEGYKVFEDAFFRGDADTVSQMYTEDAELLVPEAPPIRGRKAITEAWRSIVGSDGNTVRVDIAEIQEGQDWAYDVDKFTASAPGGKRSQCWQAHRDLEATIHRRMENSPRHFQL